MSSFLDSTKERVAAAASALNLAADVSAMVEQPKNVIAFEIPQPLEGGETRVYRAWRVQHNDVLGPYKGGIRYHPASNLDEVKALASLMTWKASLIGIPYGGAKGAITVDPKGLSPRELEAVSRSYVRHLVEYIGPKRDIPAPDVGTSPQVMAWMADEYAKLTGQYEPTAFTGKPVEIGGSFGRDTATGFGGAVALREFLRLQQREPAGVRVAIQGFGAVGSVIARELFRQGYRIVGLSDSKGAILNQDGIDVDAVITMREGRVALNQKPCPLDEASGGACRVASNAELLECDADVVVPAALEDAITLENAERIRAPVVLEMANGPVSAEAEAKLAGRGIELIPDILANAGGVVGSYFEWVQGLQRFFWDEAEVTGKIERIMANALHAVADDRSRNGGTWREACYRRAVSRVAVAMRLRGWV